MKGAVDVHRALLERSVAHEIVRLPRVVLTADDLPDALGLPPTRCVVSRMYDVGARDRVTTLVAVLVPAGGVVDTRTVLTVTGARVLQPAPPERVNAVTDYSAQLVCPALLHPSVTVLADRTLSGDEIVYTATGDGGTALGIRARDLLAEAAAAVANLQLTSTTATEAYPVDPARFGGTAGLAAHTWR